MERTIQDIERALADICSNAYPGEWDENHVTFSMMRMFRETFSSRTLRFDGWTKNVEWKSYKNKGGQETKYGDIALLVNVQFSDGQQMKGVASLEAKRLYNTGSFASIDTDQLERILRNAPYSHLLLYYPNPAEHLIKFKDPSHWRSCMWASPINTANQYLKQTDASDNDTVIRVALPFTMLLFARIFWGLDLDFRPEVYDEIIKGIEANNVVPANYLGKIDIYYRERNQEPISVELSDNWQEV